MKFTSLKMNSIVIAPSHLHMQIREQIVKEKAGVLGLRIVSLSQFLASYIHEELPSLPNVLLQVQKEIHLEDFVTYQNIVHSPLFLKECYQFINDIRQWDITIEDLPKENDAQKELQHILHAFEAITVKADLIKKATNIIASQSLYHVYIVESYETLEETALLDLLCKQGAHKLPMETYECKKEFYHAVNKRAEIEACAQYIITHKLNAEDVHISLCDMTYQPILKQVFDRYAIPCTMLQIQRASSIAKRFISLIMYYVYPDSEHMLTCLDTGLFQRKGIHQVREYMQIFAHDFFTPFTHTRNIQDSGHILDTYTLASLQELEEVASTTADELRPLFLTLKQAESTYEVFSLISEHVKETLHTSEDTSMYTQLISLLEDVHDSIHTKEDMEFLIPFIEEMSIHESPNVMQGVLIHSLTQAILDKPHHFMLGATQSNYPAFSTKKGIFDELYVSTITKYPTMQVRYQHYLHELQSLLSTSKNIYISYPLGTYEGKGMECALEIEQFMNIKSIPYPIQENFVPVARIDVIDSDTAKQLYVHNNIVHGSISSIERYVKCPFSYFLRYGLGIKEPMKPGFPDAYAGTLSHYILESLTTTYGKEYTLHAHDTIEKILKEELSTLHTLFPSMQGALENVKQRIQTSMTQTLQTLQDYEKHSSLSPSKCEYEFHYELPIEDAIVLSMRGFIDRIDESREFACILDYKSSVKTLSEPNVFAALQLQLLTYAMVLAKESGKDMLGAFYISLKNENISYSAGSISRRKPVTHTMNDTTIMEQEQKKAHRFNGWVFDEHIECIDDDASHIKGLRMNKDGIIKARTIYDLPTITNHFTTMYQMIIKRMIQGDIACKPIEEACTYCVYHEICRFNGFYEEKKQLIVYGDEIYHKGENEDA